MLVEEALVSSIHSASLEVLSKDKQKVTTICSDHTRLVPSKCIIPPMLTEIGKGNPNAEITLLIATGMHRPTTREELIDKFGEEIVENEHIYVHKSREEDMLVEIVILPSGAPLVINRLAAEAVAASGAVLIMCASCSDGSGGEDIYRAMHECSTVQELYEEIQTRAQDETEPD